ncbi:MAG TPA: hypothetical protein VM536_16985 [Chloroflexia bacterium]|nr:hypothetical protein [Chloroflexia bacterium]
MQQPQYPCPRCGAPIVAGQGACTNCGLALDAQSLAAWQAEQFPTGAPADGGAPPPGYAAPPPPPGYGGPPPPGSGGPQPPPGYTQVQPGYNQPVPPVQPMAPARRSPVLTFALLGIALALVACGVVAALALGSDNEAKRVANGQATLTAVSRQLTAPPTGVGLAPRTAKPGATATLRPDDADIQLLDFTNYTDEAGNLIVVGEVENQGKGVADAIEVEGEALDVNQTPVASGKDLLLALVQLPPGVKAPYQIRMSQPAADIDIDSVHVRGTFKTFDPDAVHVFVRAIGLTAPSPDFKVLAGNAPRVTGEVRNGGTKEAILVKLLVSGYDVDDKLIAVEQGLVTPGTIPAGGTATYNVAFSAPGAQDIARVAVLPIGSQGK